MFCYGIQITRSDSPKPHCSHMEAGLSIRGLDTYRIFILITTSICLIGIAQVKFLAYAAAGVVLGRFFRVPYRGLSSTAPSNALLHGDEVWMVN